MSAYKFAVCATLRAARVAVALTPVLMVALAVAPASAAVIVDANGFEPPQYSTTFPPAGPGAGSGQLEGQVPATFNGTWLRTKGIGLSTGVVQAAVVDAGVQAVRIDRAANSDDRWAVPVDGYPSIGQNFICISWSMRVQQSAGNGDTTFGPYFAVEAYDDDANPGGDPALFGSLGVDAATGEVLYQAVGTGFLTTPVGNPTVAFGSWHDYMIELNFAADEYRIFLDNVLLAKQPLTAGFVDQAIIPGGLNEFTDADIATVAAAGNPASLALTGTAYYDNFLVEESNVACDIPEPTACVLAALGIMGVRGRRQSSRR